MRRLMVLVAVCVVVLAVGGVEGGLAQTPAATPGLPFHGELGTATVGYAASGLRLIGSQAFKFAVAEFATADDAQAALTPALTRTQESLPTAKLQATSAPHVGDESEALSGSMIVETTTTVVTILAFRVGRYVHIWVGIALASDPMTDFLTIIDQMQADHRLPSTADNLSDHLPHLNDLPPGFTVQPVNGTPASMAP